MRFIDDFLNKITMYRLVLYELIVLIVAALVFSFFGLLPFDATALAFSTVVILLVSLGTNWIFARAYDAKTNVESVYITALILALIISPVMAKDVAGVGFLVFASVWSMAGKYIFAIGKKHLFNPAAFAVAVTALVINEPATWWVGGNLIMLPFVLVGGLLIVRKIQRFDLVLSFMAVALVAIVATSSSSDYATAISRTFLHSSLFFFAFVMLTEPLTTPPTRTLRIIYGAIVGFLFAPNVHIGSFYLTPELALLIGNVFSYLVSPKGRYMLKLERIEEAANGVYDFVFSPDRRFNFKPGQYLEWTLSHHYPDDRGNRRYFTIASAPTENSVRLGVKFYDPASTFKRALAAMKKGDTISVSHLAGSFTLPRKKDKKLVFIAGGIGVTPFRSMVQHMLDTRERRPVVMFYANKTAADIAYKDIFDRAYRELGMPTVHVLSDENAPVPGALTGRVDAALIAKYVPDYRERTFYISGPHGMVEAIKKALAEMGVSRLKIKSDFFPGFA